MMSGALHIVISETDRLDPYNMPELCPYEPLALLQDELGVFDLEYQAHEKSLALVKQGKNSLPTNGDGEMNQVWETLKEKSQSNGAIAALKIAPELQGFMSLVE